MSNNYPRYHQFTLLIHLITFFTILVVLGAVFLREFTEDDDFRLQMLNLHRSLGVIVLLLVIVRLFIRYFYFFSHITAELPKILRRLASAAHFTIYTFLFAVPLLGWLFTSAAGKPLIFFGVVHLPALMHKNRELSEGLGEAHEVLAWLFIVVILGHTAAALWHHYVRKDHVLRSMLPTWLAGK